MKNVNSLCRICLLMLVVHLTGLSDALSCSQCNMRQRGISNTCLAPRNMTDCLGCMKTVTKVKLRDSGYMTGWERMSVVVSRFCMRRGSTKIKPEGCYLQQNNGGYTERCFCYTDNCNSGASRLTSDLLASFFPSSYAFVMCALTLILAFMTNCGCSATKVTI